MCSRSFPLPAGAKTKILFFSHVTDMHLAGLKTCDRVEIVDWVVGFVASDRLF